MGSLAHFPAITVPPAVARVIMRMDRSKLEAFVSAAIDIMDVMDPDSDFEETGLEDDFISHPADGPGCPVADVAELHGDETDGDFCEDDACRGDWGTGPGCTISDDDHDQDGDQ